MSSLKHISHYMHKVLDGWEDQDKAAELRKVIEDKKPANIQPHNNQQHAQKHQKLSRCLELAQKQEIAEAVERFSSVSYSVVYHRLLRRGWDMHLALNAPSMSQTKHPVTAETRKKMPESAKPEVSWF